MAGPAPEEGRKDPVWDSLAGAVGCFGRGMARWVLVAWLVESPICAMETGHRGSLAHLTSLADQPISPISPGPALRPASRDNWGIRACRRSARELR